MKSECLNIRGLNVWYKKRQARYKKTRILLVPNHSVVGLIGRKWSWEDNLAKSFK